MNNKEAPKTTPATPPQAQPPQAQSQQAQPPQTKVGRPRGNPPLVISSRPWIPVGHLGNGTARKADL